MKKPPELIQIEKLLREMREVYELEYRQAGPEFVTMADRLDDVVKHYSLRELHAYVRGMLYGL